KKSQRHGGAMVRSDDSIERVATIQHGDPSEALAIHELLDRLAETHGRKAEVVKLRYFLGCTFVEIGDILECSPDSAEEDWTYARAWLKRAWTREN
ncbi:MAG TPA: ECF-type sigma factor, partial [Pirellulaceae bacterium]